MQTKQDQNDVEFVANLQVLMLIVGNGMKFL